ncbi:MAG: hypothetical protein JO320_26595 [Alphaproteobacteria bacterium]|nr:hypothetical protein [Alphaproteobacteria bacterium]MBV9378573.1 hypothetical protein [Alphaproteobacteria bacterium]
MLRGLGDHCRVAELFFRAQRSFRRSALRGDVAAWLWDIEAEGVERITEWIVTMTTSQ